MVQSPLTTASCMLELEVKGFADDFDVLSFSGRERLSSLYAFDLLVESELEWDVVCKPLLSAAACFRIHGPDGALRTVRGIVNRVDTRGKRHAKAPNEYRIRIVPRLWLLTQRHGSRIFQDCTLRQIVETVLGTKQVGFRWAASDSGKPRAYCVQYEETDFAFIERLLAEEGIFYFFEPPPEDDDAGADQKAGVKGDVVVFGDAASSYLPISPTDDDVAALARAARPQPKKSEKLVPAPALAMRHDGGRVQGEVVHRFGLRRQVRATKLELRDYEYQRPQFRRESQASVFKSGGAEPVPMDTLLETMSQERAGDIGITHYDHRAPGQESHASDWAARVLLEQLRAEAASGSGRSNCRRLGPGYRFNLEDSTFDADYVVTAIRHRGHIPERARTEAEKAKAPYANRFECVKSRIVFRPPQRRFRVQQVLETATVVGPDQQEGTVYTDALGRIKVHFHWDREGGLDETSSCWIRVSQSWAGQGMGVQFIPRVGMEVIVGFLGGDIDCPIILGAAHNATHPVPFPLPGSAAVSGIRTQTIPGGNGYNELSFDDTKQNERVAMRAQRDMTIRVAQNMDIAVGNDRHSEIEHDEGLIIRGSQTESVAGSRNEEIGGKFASSLAGERNETIGGDHVLSLGGSRTETVAQNRLVRVGGSSSTIVTGRADETFSDELMTSIAGRERREVAGAQDIRVADDLATHVRGCHVTVVGKHGTKRSYLVHVEGTSQLSASDVSEIVSEKSIVLRCGESQIMLTPKNIEIRSPEVLLKGKDATVTMASGKAKVIGKQEAIVSAATVRATAKGAGLTLDANATVEASKIALKSGSAQAEQLKADPEAPPPTKIALTDQNGKPIPFARYVLVFDDGARQSGVLDRDGKAELSIEGSPKIVFPDVHAVKPS